MENEQLGMFADEDIPIRKIEKPENRCRNCIHIYKHQYGSMKYCRLQKDPRTSYGHKKIKANGAACHLFNKSVVFK